jgi:hypothetical protein
LVRSENDQAEKELQSAKSSLLGSLIGIAKNDMILPLGEKYQIFDIIIRLCEGDRSKLQFYMDKFKDSNFAHILFKEYMESGKISFILDDQ